MGTGTDDGDPNIITLNMEHDLLVVDDIDTIIYRLDPNWFTDLLTTYRIVQRRQICSNISSDYAKEYVRKQFEKLVSTLLMLTTERPLYLVDLYCYLRAHVLITPR